MNEQELREHASLQGWLFVRQNGLALGGYWVNADRSVAYYAKLQGEAIKKEKGK